MKYVSTLLAVKNMRRSIQFYHDVLGLQVAADFGANVTLEGGVTLQTLDTWKSFLQTDRVVFENNAGELYFEAEDLDAFCARLRTFDVRLVHACIEHRWGQRAIRFYDPDGHILEVGEPMDVVVRRFLDGGLSPEETAARMDVPLAFVRSCLERTEGSADGV